MFNYIFPPFVGLGTTALDFSNQQEILKQFLRECHGSHCHSNRRHSREGGDEFTLAYILSHFNSLSF